MALFGGITLPGKPDLENIRKLDLLPLPALRRMSRLGMAIDKEYCQDLTSTFEAEMRDLAKDITSYIPADRLEDFCGKSIAAEADNSLTEDNDDGERIYQSSSADATMNVGSAEQIGQLLFDILGIGFGKNLKLTKAGDRISTGKKQLELLRHDHPVIPKVLAYRERSKLVSTYTRKLPLISKFHPRGEDCPVCGLWHECETWRVHGEIVTTRTGTGRLAHRNPNLANIPARTDLGAAVRAAFIASPGISGLKKRRHDSKGTLLVSTDFSQIELRDLAHCAKAASMIDVYEHDKDIHVYTATAAFDLNYEKYDRLLRLDKKKMLSPAEKHDLDHFKQFNRMPSKNLNFMICLLEDQRVLTNRGYVRIMDVTTDMKVWDGLEFVSHDGVVFKGYKEAIKYQGVHATPDHKVWTREGRMVSLSTALAEGLDLADGSSPTTPPRYSTDRFENRNHRRESGSYGSLFSLQEAFRNYGPQFIERPSTWMSMQAARSIPRQPSGQSFARAVQSNQAKNFQPQLSVLSRLRRPWDKESLSGLQSFRGLHSGKLASRELQISRYRAHRQQWSLRRGELAARSARYKSSQYSPQQMDDLQRRAHSDSRFTLSAHERLSRLSTQSHSHEEFGIPRRTLAGDIEAQAQGKVPVYDILNCGPRNRFVCEGKIVSNCYGSTVIGLIAQLALSGLYWTEDQGNQFIRRWFELYPEVEEYMRIQAYRYRRYGLVWDEFGRIRLGPESESVHSWIRDAGQRQMGNVPIQGIAAEQMKLAIAACEVFLLELLYEQDVWCWPAMTIHDQLLSEVEADYAEYIGQRKEEEFSNVMTDRETGETYCRVPIKADKEIISRWTKE